MTRSIDELIFRMPAVARQSTDQWTRDFALSILRQARRPSWRPSPKQTGIMTSGW